MKKIGLALIFTTCLIGLIWSSCSAAPFLVCNPYPSTGTQPDYFSVVMDSGTAVQSTPYSVTGGVELHYDLSATATGSHTASVAACSNTWGCSAATPFTFTKALPAAPAGIGVSGQ